MTRYTVKEVTVHPTTICTFECAHCMYAASPSKGSEMAMDEVRGYLSQLPELEVTWLGISGGEPTLFSGLDEMISYASDVRRETGYPKEIYMNTNGSCARDFDRTLARVRKWKEEGLDHLRISNDKYHKKFDQREQIANFRKIRKYDGVPNIEFLPSDAIMPIGRARDRVPKREWDLDPPIDCPLMDLVLADDRPSDYSRCLYIFPDGVYACRGIGYIGKGRMTELIENATKNPLFQVIASIGVRRAVKAAREKMPANIRQEARYLHECALCSDVFNNEKVVAAMQSEAPRILEIVEKEWQEEMEREKIWHAKIDRIIDGARSGKVLDEESKKEYGELKRRVLDFCTT